MKKYGMDLNSKKGGFHKSLCGRRYSAVAAMSEDGRIDKIESQIINTVEAVYKFIASLGNDCHCQVVIDT